VGALLHGPDILFLEEAGSALYAKTEENIYELLLQELPGTAIASIAHWQAVAKFHQIHWQFKPDTTLPHKIDSHQGGFAIYESILDNA
jgi:ABC-type uncharacterized transport system fused permease/ATPase subunit